MDDAKKRLIQESVFNETGVILHVDNPRIDGIRGSLIAWIDGYTSQNGVRFQIKPHGLKSYKIIVEMGLFALPCIELIQQASEIQYKIARGILKKTAESNDCRILIYKDQTLDDWKVQKDGFRIEITTRLEKKQYDDSTIVDVSLRFLVPLVIAFSELIGSLNNLELIDYQIEGELHLSIVQRRERSRRNRAICLAINGDSCSVCGFKTDSSYNLLDSIIEVHHIEPISNLKTPRIYNPQADLIPLCPNCHRAAHKRTPPFLPSELKSMII